MFFDSFVKVNSRISTVGVLLEFEWVPSRVSTMHHQHHFHLIRVQCTDRGFWSYNWGKKPLCPLFSLRDVRSTAVPGHLHRMIDGLCL